MLLSRFILPLPFWGLLYFICGRIKGGGERWNIQPWLFAPIILNETEKRRHLSRFLFITMIFIVILFFGMRMIEDIFLKKKFFFVIWEGGEILWIKDIGYMSLWWHKHWDMSKIAHVRFYLEGKKIWFGPMHFLGYLSPNLSFAVNQESWFRTVSNNYHFYYKVLSSCKSISSGTYWAAQLSGRPRGAMMSIVQCPWPIINLQYI